MKVMISLSAVPLSLARKYAKGWNKNGLAMQVIGRYANLKLKRKGGNVRPYRLYLPIEAEVGNSKAKVPTDIEAAIHAAGYIIEDYVLGIASKDDGKRKIRIGKILPDALKQKFVNDPQRSAHKDDYYCVISGHPYDIIGMSTGRRWDMTSCMRLAIKENDYSKGIHHDIVKHDVAEGTIVAYAIKPSDTNLKKPHARLLIKPFFKNGNPKGPVYFKVEIKPYGTPVPGFIETVQKWLRHVNADAETGVYHLHEELYNDGIGAMVLNFPFPDDPDHFLATYQNIEWASQYSPYDYYPELISGDKRWVVPLLEFFINNDRFEHVTDALKVTEEVYGAEEAGKLLDGIGDSYVADIEKAVPYENIEMVKASTKLNAYAKQAYRYDGSDGEGTNWAFRAAIYDARWFGKIKELRPRFGMSINNVLIRFWEGEYAWTREFQDSQYEGASMIRTYVGFMSKLMLEYSSAVTPYIHDCAEKFDAPTKYDRGILELLERFHWRPIVRRFTTRRPNAVLMDLDISWADGMPSLLADCGRESLEHKLFAKLVGLKNDEVNKELIYTLEQYRTARDNPAVGRKDIQEFIGNMLVFHGDDGEYGNVIQGLYRELVGDPKEILG